MPELAQYKLTLLNEFEPRTDAWVYSDVDNRLREIVGHSYKNAKSIISLAHEKGLWPQTVKQYIITKNSNLGYVSCELNHVAVAVFSALTLAEKLKYGIK